MCVKKCNPQNQLPKYSIGISILVSFSKGLRRWFLSGMIPIDINWKIYVTQYRFFLFLSRLINHLREKLKIDLNHKHFWQVYRTLSRLYRFILWVCLLVCKSLRTMNIHCQLYNWVKYPSLTRQLNATR